MFLPRTIQPYYFHANLIWWDGPFKAAPALATPSLVNIYRGGERDLYSKTYRNLLEATYFTLFLSNRQSYIAVTWQRYTTLFHT